jgi:asparagine synthase (glutamine-hydrolysing)
MGRFAGVFQFQNECVNKHKLDSLAAGLEALAARSDDLTVSSHLLGSMALGIIQSRSGEQIAVCGDCISNNPTVGAELHRSNSMVSDRVEKLRVMVGAFAVAYWDEGIGQLSLAVDHLGVSSLYYSLVEGAVVFATDISMLIALRFVPKDFCPLTFGWRSAMRMDGDSAGTWFSGIQSVRPGSVVTFGSSGGEASRTYWRPPVRSSCDLMDSFDDAISKIRLTFDEAFREQTASAESVSVMLSGGFDSSVIAATAVSRGLKVELFHVIYEGSNADQNQDLYYAKLMAAYLGLPLNVLEVTFAEVCGVMDELVTVLGRPVVHGAEFGMYFFYRDVSKRNSQLVLGGHAADSNWGTQISFPPSMLNTDFRAENHCQEYLSRHYYQSEQPEWHKFLYEYLYPELRVSRRIVEDMIWDEGFREYREFPSLEPSKRARVHELFGIDGYIGKMTSAIASHFGMKEEKVFLNHKLVELSFSFPEFFLNRATAYTEKPLLKQALGERVPSEILNRKKVGFQPPRDEAISRGFRGALKDGGIPLGMAISDEVIARMPMTQLIFLDSTRRWLKLCTEA